MNVKNSSTWRKLYKSTSVQCALPSFECFRKWRNLLNRPQQQLSTIYRSSLSMSVTHTFVPIREIGSIFALIFARADRWWFDDRAEKRAWGLSVSSTSTYINHNNQLLLLVPPLSDWSKHIIWVALQAALAHVWRNCITVSIPRMQIYIQMSMTARADGRTKWRRNPLFITQMDRLPLLAAVSHLSIRLQSSITWRHRGTCKSSSQTNK